MRAKPAIALALGAVAVVAGALNLPKTAVAYVPAAQAPKMLFGKAPDFSAKTADGKSYDLASLTKSGPVYLYFIKKDCPINAMANQFYNKIYAAYGDKAPLLGIINGNAGEYKVYNGDHKMPYPVVLDPDLKVTGSYSVERSPWVIEVTADGKIGRTWKGYDQEYLQQINKAVAEAAKVPVAKIDFTEAPTDPRYG
jgi:peroxiredoxin